MNQESNMLHKTNKVALIIIWLALILGGLPNLLFDSGKWVNSLIVWGLGIAILLPATVIYFKNKNSFLIRHFVSCGAVLLVYSLLFVQKGALEDLYWVPICIVASVLFFDRYVLISATVMAVGMAVLLFYSDRHLFFPSLNLSQFTAYCITLVITGVVLTVQNDYGKRLLNRERKQFDEISRIYNELKTVLQNIEKTSNMLDQCITGIKDEALNVKDETIQITANIQQFAAALEQTAQLASESNLTLSAIKELIDKTAGHSEDMIASSSLAYDTANEGKTVLDDLVNQIRIVAESMQTAGEMVAMLSVESKKITDITGFINDITRKTNLLALNASIEASRAGAVGEGFMVVAGEMKNFAEQTADALSGITQILRDLMEKIDQVRARITDGESAIRTGIEKTTLTYDCFINIINKTNTIKSNIEGVIRDIKFLAGESTAVFSNITEITKFTEESVATIQQLTACSLNQSRHINIIEEKLAVDLVRLSDELKTLIVNR